MGGATRLKQMKKEQAENAWMASFVDNNRKLKQLSLHVEPPITDKLEPYRNLTLRDLKDFTLKTKSKDKDKQLVEAVRFAFGKYSVAQALTNVWRSNEGNWNLRKFDDESKNLLKADLRLWYICVATGGSLYKEHAKPFLSKKEVHYFINCNYDIRPNQALCYAVAKAVAEKDEGICLKISRSKLQEKTLDDFWKSVIRFFAQNPTITLNQVNDLADYLDNRRRENAQFSIAGHSLAALLKRMDDWHRDLQRAKAIGNHQWTGFDMPDDQFETLDEMGNTIVWKFHQILNTKELAAEGNRMRHCVFSYKSGCIDGRLSIWSLTKTDLFNGTSPKVTIELRKGGWIAQARGLANRATRADENNVIRMWMKKYNLSYGYGY